MKKIVYILVFICVIVSTGAADVLIDITIIDADTHEPLEGVKVLSHGVDSIGMPIMGTGYTDNNGRYYQVLNALAALFYFSLYLDGYIIRSINDTTTGTFELEFMTGPFTITIDSELAYLVDIDPPGGVYEEATRVILTANNLINPDGSGYYFVEWQGDYTGNTTPIEVYITHELIVTPVYIWREPFPVPEITALSPASGSTKTTVTITGSNFNIAEDDIIFFGPAGNSMYQTQSSHKSTDSKVITYIIPSIIYPKCRYEEPGCNDSSIPATPGIYELAVSNGVHTSNTVLFEITETSGPTPGPTPEPINIPGLGDANSDGNIDIVDALIVAQYYVGLNSSNFYRSRADTNCDSQIDIVDALLIARYYVGLIAGFCM